MILKEEQEADEKLLDHEKETKRRKKTNVNNLRDREHKRFARSARVIAAATSRQLIY